MRYEEVEPDEAIDLVFTLPRGSMLVSALHPELSWSLEREAIADLQDTIYEVFIGGGRRVMRPKDVIAQRAATEKARNTKRTIEETEWEAV